MSGEPKPLLAYCLSFYQEVKALPRCLDSIFTNTNSFPFKVIAMDGVYEGYPSKTPLSTDGSRELIQEQYPTVELYNVPNLPERKKRQKYVDIVAAQDIPFLLIIDADEWFEPKPKWKKLKQELEEIMEDYESDKGNIYNIKCVDLVTEYNIIRGNECINNRPRLWFKPEELQYKNTHYTFARRPGASKGPIRANKTIPSDIIQMYHNPHNNRTAERLKKRSVYEDRLVTVLEG